MSSRFPAIVDLQLPRRGAWKENSRFATRLTRAVLRPWFRDLQLLPLSEVMDLFPHLQVVQGVRYPVGLEPERDADDPSAQLALRQLRHSYPLLHRVNGRRIHP